MAYGTQSHWQEQANREAKRLHSIGKSHDEIIEQLISDGFSVNESIDAAYSFSTILY